jgi:4-hydroxybenzoate polyprenyltransferase
MGKVKTYLSLIKFSHTIFAMPFAMIGFFLGFLPLDFSVIRPDQAMIFEVMQATAKLIRLAFRMIQ